MYVNHLAEVLLTPEELQELQASLELLKNQNYPEFYEKNHDLIANILSIDNYAEFEEFMDEDEWEQECFYFEFFCAKNYALRVGGYEDDLTEKLTAFFDSKKLGYPEIAAIIHEEKIYTDYDGKDNFTKALVKLNKVLSAHHLQLVVLDDDIYCACEYTILLLEQSLAEELVDSWMGNCFEIYL